MFGPESADGAVFRRIARRVEDILEAAREREGQGQVLALDIDARFRLENAGAVQFQVASAILEEAGGLGQEEVVGELLTLGLAAVLSGAARAAGTSVSQLKATLDVDEAESLPALDDAWSTVFPVQASRSEERVLN